MNIEHTSILKRNSDIVCSEVDGETVMMDLNFENYFGMKSVGTRIWQLLDSEISFGSLCEQLINEYEVSEKQCKEDVTRFLVELYEQEMVHIN